MPRLLLATVLAVGCLLLLPLTAAAVEGGTITPTTNAGDLAAAIDNGSSAVTGASFVTTPPSGTPNAVATLGLAGFPLGGGSYAIMTTGNAALAEGTPPDNQGSFASVDDLGGHVRANPDANEQDVSILRVDLDVPPTANCLSFGLRFLSEEYPDFVGSTKDDSFIAELDTDDWTTSNVGSVTAPHNFAFDTAHNPITVNTAGITAGAAAGTTYGGATTPLQASTPITPGAHSLYLSIFDQGDGVYDSAAFLDDLVVGQKSAAQCQTGAIDAPLVTLDQPATGATVTDATPTLSGQAGTAPGDAGTVTVDVYAGPTATGSPIETKAVPVSDGAWTIDSDHLDDGVYTAQARQSDTDGNVGTSTANTFTVAATGGDTTPPAVSLEHPDDGITLSDSTPTISGAGGRATGDASSVTVRIYRGTQATGAPVQTRTATVAASGAWAVVPAGLADGTYTVRAEQDDSAGNRGLSAPHTFRIDTRASDHTAPKPGIDEPAEDASLTDRTPRIAGPAGTALNDGDTVSVRLYRGRTTTGAPTWTGTAKVVDGAYAIDTSELDYGELTAQVSQRDLAGNTGTSAARHFTVDPPSGADLQVSVTPSLPLLVGRPATYTVEVHNHGPADATGVRLAAAMPAGADLPSHEAHPPATPACSRSELLMSCFAGSIRAGDTLTYQFVLTPRRSGSMDVNAVVTAAQADPVQSTNRQTADATAVKPPTLAKTIATARVSGTVRIKRPGSKRFRTLSTEALLPVGSLVDATHGRVRLTSRRAAGGPVQTADFYLGEFRLRQVKAHHGLTLLDLEGGSFTGCPKSSSQSPGGHVARRRRRHRRLWGSGHGSFRTRGRFGSATVRGTIWYTSDRCNATYFKTRRGVVTVRNYVKHKTVKVPAGHSYYARAPKQR